MTKARLFVISAPSGSGKTTLSKRLMADNLGLVLSVSMTTRPPRPGEKDGVDYHFVSEKKFKSRIEKGAFLEYEENFGNLYGTPKDHIEKLLHKGASVLLNIDVKGAMKVRRLYPDRSVLIFVLPPSIKALKNRLKTRMSDGKDEIACRLKLARKEMGFKDRYDYRIVNDRLDSAYRKLKRIIITESKEGD